MSSQLFSPLTLRGVTLANRIAVAPMCQYSANDGVVGDWHLMHLGNFAVSGAGLVIAEATGVEARGRISPGCPGLWTDEQEEAWARVLHFCGDYGNTVMGIQLAHAGRKASSQAPWLGGKPMSPDEGGWASIGPSTTPFGEGWQSPKAMDRDDMDAVTAAFVSSTERSARLGFDFMELHGAHGYLMSSFLSPLANDRNDDYGGTLENRMRFPLEVVAAVREVWPEDKPLCMRISGTDWLEEGWTEDDSVAFALAAKDLGLDILHLSSGGNTMFRPPVGPGEPGYQLPSAEKVRREAGLPTIGVGYINDPQFAEDVIASGKCDMVAMARGMLYNPRFPLHAAEALGVDVDYVNQYARAKPELWPNAFAERREAG